MGYRLRNVGATKIWLWIAPQLSYSLGKDLIRLIADYLFDFYQFPFDGRLTHKNWTKWQCETFMSLLWNQKMEIIIESPGIRYGKTTALSGIVTAIVRNSEYLELAGSGNTLACIPATMRNFRYVGPTYLFVDDGSVQSFNTQFMEDCVILNSKILIIKYHTLNKILPAQKILGEFYSIF